MKILKTCLIALKKKIMNKKNKKKNLDKILVKHLKLIQGLNLLDLQKPTFKIQILSLIVRTNK
jgi:hypothetical protein